uniref:Uncharacterized protein n=1 Tax=Anopheles albimanus TaxID=7167 RepID=A0A182FXI1_ANOAL
MRPTVGDFLTILLRANRIRAAENLSSLLGETRPAQPIISGGLPGRIHSGWYELSFAIAATERLHDHKRQQLRLLRQKQRPLFSSDLNIYPIV